MIRKDYGRLLNFNQLIKRFGLTKKQNELQETKNNQQEFLKWLKEINPEITNIQKPNLDQIISKYFDENIDEFMKLHLKEVEVEAKTESFPNEEMDEELNEAYKVISKQMLNDVVFKNMKYQGNPKPLRYQTSQLIFDYNQRTNESIKTTKKTPKDNANEIEFLLHQHVDMALFDYGFNNYDSILETILEYIYQYSCFFAVDKQKPLCDKGESDQLKTYGYVKNRVTILVPFKKEAYEILTRIISISETTFNEEFLAKLATDYESEETAFEDKFVIGLFIKNSKIHFTSNLNFAEIVITTTGWISNNMENHSLLSSIEVLYLHKVNELSIQNHESLEVCLAKMNQLPDHKYCTEDFRLIRDIYINNISQFFRQNIAFGEFGSVQLNSLFNRFFLNKNGLVKSRQFFPRYFNEDNKTSSQFTLNKVEIASIKNEFQEKFNYFKSQIWEKERENEELTGALIVLNDYLQYQQFKQYFQEKGSPIGFISEHTPKNKIQSVFARFNNGELKYILVTERAIYYQVTDPKKFKNLIFFGFPFFFKVFEDLMNELKSETESKVIMVFSKKDAYEIEKLFGTAKTVEFLSAKNKFKILEL